MTRRNFSLIIYWVIAAAAVIFLTLWAARVSQGAISDCIDATCRIRAAEESTGSGCVFEISQGYVYVLTAAHVVGRSSRVQCEFWRFGHQSRPLAGEVIARSKASDGAVVALPASSFEGVLPAAIPLAPLDYTVPKGTTLTSVGCAQGGWSTG
jgi:S1-C subfamily serine protease